MRRREFIVTVGGAAAAWPLVARAQQPERMRRIGMLMTLAADDPFGQAQVAAFQQALQQLGWNDGRNVRIDIRWDESDADRARRYAQELVALAPDIFLAGGTISVGALQHVAPGARSGGYPDRRARHWRYRTRRGGLRALGEWRPDCDGDRNNAGGYS